MCSVVERSLRNVQLARALARARARAQARTQACMRACMRACIRASYVVLICQCTELCDSLYCFSVYQKIFVCLIKQASLLSIISKFGGVTIAFYG
jgi:hypothetical protein